MTDLERVREALEATWHDECPADYEPYPVQILDAHLKEDAEREGRRIFAEGRRNAMEAELADLKEEMDLLLAGEGDTVLRAELTRLREALQDVITVGDRAAIAVARNALKEKE